MMRNQRIRPPSFSSRQLSLRALLLAVAFALGGARCANEPPEA